MQTQLLPEKREHTLRIGSAIMDFEKNWKLLDFYSAKIRYLSDAQFQIGNNDRYRGGDSFN